MNKLFSTIMSAVIVMAGVSLFSCSDDDGIRLTGIEGCPSALLSDGQLMASFIHDGNRFAGVHYSDGHAAHFNYEDGNLSGISYTPPKGVADGHGWVHFTKTSDHLYQVSRGGEPSGDISYIDEMALDANGLPTKISFIGIYRLGANGNELMEEGGGYALPTFDSATQQLLKIEVFDKDSQLQQVYTYEYDQAPGSSSRLDLPVWFAGWWSYRHAYSSQFEDVQFLNFRNNVTKITSEDKVKDKSSSITYIYEYNESGYPVRVSSDAGEGTEVSIRY